MTSKPITLPNRQRSSFDMPINFMPKPERMAMRALYKFCHAIDAAVDEMDGGVDALEQWRGECEALYGGSPKTREGMLMQAVAKEYGLAKEHFISLCDGIAMDLADTMVWPDKQTLDQYCYNVASAVGLLALPILGCDNGAGQRLAIQIGHALQRTNIMRDMEEDALRGRIYFPAHYLSAMQRDKVTPQELLEDHELRRTLRLMLSEKTKRCYELTDIYTTPELSKPMAPALLMRDIYHRQFRRMQGLDWKIKNSEQVRQGGNSLPILLARWAYYRMAG